MPSGSTEHELARLRRVNRGVELRGEHNRRPRFANRTRRAVVGKGQFRAGNDFLSFVREKDDEVITLANLGGLVEPAQSMEILESLRIVLM
jgi:hypothetical protein